MSRGTSKKGLVGCSGMHTVQRRRKPKWMKASYEERVASRDTTSAKRLSKLEAKGLVDHKPAVEVHTCGTTTVLRESGRDGRFNSYQPFCPSCGTFAID